MNKSMIAYILGWIMKLEGLFMLIPVLVALIYREHNGVWFAIVAVCALVFGAVVTHKKPESNVFYMREGCIATAMSWFIMSVIGCLPFFLSGEIPSFTDALFETVSGFTTTGSASKIYYAFGKIFFLNKLSMLHDVCSECVKITVG